MPLRLTYLGQSAVPVEVEGLTPASLRGMSLAEIERLPIVHGNTTPALAELFRVRGNAHDMQWELEGDLSGVHWIGAGMAQGSIRVLGNAGRHVGSEMTGGSIVVEGNAGDWVGGELHGGRIQVFGSAGHLVGSAYRGSQRGMTGGVIVIAGDVGNEAGHSMRRGLLAIGGNCGDFPGLNMIAGTIIIFGQCGLRAGAGMRRGTLALLGPERTRLLPTFRSAGPCWPSFMVFYLRQLARLGMQFDERLLTTAYELWSGDLVTIGRGEILMPVEL